MAESTGVYTVWSFSRQQGRQFLPEPGLALAEVSPVWKEIPTREAACPCHS